MRRKIAARELRRMEEQAYENYSEAFRCVRANFDDLVKCGAGRKGGLSWESVAALLTRQGQTNIHGAPLSADSVRKLFGRVRCAVAAENATPKPDVATRRPPSRTPPGWQPPVAPPMPESRPRAAAPASSTTDRPSPDPYEGRSEAAKAKLAALDAQLAWRDRYLHPPPERGQ